MEQLGLFENKIDTVAPCFISCSFGKDSIASAILALEAGMNVERILYCHVMFDKDISSEMPEQEDFIFNHAIPEFERRYGVETDVVVPELTMVDLFYKVRQSGRNVGMIYGWPCVRGCWG